MGFDIYDIKPKTDKGEYFRNNVWWYRGLHAFLTATCSDILSEKDLEKINFNDGYRITKVKTRKIVKRLEEILSDKSKYNNMLASIEEALNENWFTQTHSKKRERAYRLDWENIQEFHDFAEQTEGFRVW